MSCETDPEFEHVPETLLTDFHDTGLFKRSAVIEWAQCVVATKWGSSTQFTAENLVEVNPYFFDRPVGTGVRMKDQRILTSGHAFSPVHTIRFPKRNTESGTEPAGFFNSLKALRVVADYGMPEVERTEEFQPSWVDYSKHYDCAAIRLEEVVGRKKRPGVVVAKVTNPHKGDPICVIHHAGGGPLVVSTGRIVDVDAHSLYHDADTRGASSGAPIFSVTGELLGIHRGMNKPDRRVAVRVDAIWRSPVIERSDGTDPVAKIGEESLPDRPRMEQEIDPGTFGVWNGGASDDPEAIVWVHSDGEHEAWAMGPSFQNAGDGDKLTFEGRPDWWFAPPPPIIEPNWNLPALWLADWKAHAALVLGEPQAQIQFIFHTRTFDNP